MKLPLPKVLKTTSGHLPKRNPFRRQQHNRKTIPYGLDCSGFVEWVFNNTFGVVVGHGGGARSRYNYCRKISWAEAQPGDLVFYPDLGHVGIVAGYDGERNVLIVHCSLNGVVVTGRVVLFCEVFS